MTIRHVSELGTGDIQRMGLQPLGARVNAEPRIRVQAEIADALKATSAFRAASETGEEGLDVSTKLSRPKTADVSSESEDDDVLDDAAL